MRVKILKTYGEIDNPDNLPADWPAECAEVGDDVPLSARVLTVEQYAQYRADRQAAYDAAMAPVEAALLAMREARAAEAGQ